jgi:Carboxypeptidase regulatory-like domain
MICSAPIALGQTKPAPPAHPAPTTGTIEGQVTDKSGTPLAGAEVKWAGEAATQSTTITTDARGSFTLPRLEPGKYLLTFTAKGCVPKTEKVKVKAGGTSKVHVRLKPPPEPKPSTM